MAVEVSRNQLTTWLFIVIVSISQAQQNKVNGSVGRSALLPCSSKFIPDQYTNFSWLKNNSLLITGTISNSEVNVQDETYRNRVQLPENFSSGNLSLLITDLKLKDFGIYRCEAFRKNQSIRSEETFLTVTRDAVSKPIVRILHPQNITDQNTVILKCEVTRGSLPITYMWHRKANKTEKAKKIKHYQQTLEINRTVKEGSGFFHCKVSNNFSTERSSPVEIPISDSATSSEETTLSTPNNTSTPRIPWLVAVATSAMVLFIVSIILITIRIVKKKMKGIGTPRILERK
ncbi:carcinoembryonic antigen-related cell adhesion molecule 15-like isoform X2 [Stegostoma tigrinum]|uniref:carcinoembryonic antigen-related cell adhesion molecule 15-like isoform X2 n=1 Tax=Stegostoma tigrinum TaxID=3053191 RepID=UPI00202B2E74|nr:carcinoembryonic antigen-related cell adhesion molecule 15-like isoform X2 [Stegostoma tigrinum]